MKELGLSEVSVVSGGCGERCEEWFRRCEKGGFLHAGDRDIIFVATIVIAFVTVFVGVSHYVSYVAVARDIEDKLDSLISRNCSSSDSQ